jgi:RNA polymerase sigma factor (TIGR02999 family)
MICDRSSAWDNPSLKYPALRPKGTGAGEGLREAGQKMIQRERSRSAPSGEPAEARIGDPYFALLYEELHRLASRELRRNGGLTLSPTTLLHETFLNVSLRASAELADRPRFMAYASRAMRGLVIDYLRRGNAQKRGRGFEIVSLSDEMELYAQSDIELERLREALEVLATQQPRLAECVDLKFFCGFSFRDIAELWNVSERTVLRDWDKARLLLNRLMGGLDPSPQPAP